MIQFKESDIDLIYNSEEEIVSVMAGTVEIWSATNFKTKDGFTFVTSDNKIFNVNK